MGLMFITHDMGVVAEMADRVVVMRNGEKVEDGPAVRIFDGAGIPIRVRCWPRCRRSASSRGRRCRCRSRRRAGAGAAGHGAADKPPVLEVQRLVKRFELRRGVLGGWRHACMRWRR